MIPLVLKDELDPRHREILKLYGQGAKSSTAKLRSMMNYLDDDGRVRSLTQYGGAMRTLRWAGRGPQIQNYPRPSKEIDARVAIEHIIWGVDAETIDFVHGNPMDVVSQCLRGAYVPAAGHAFAVCDYSGIEARVVAWLAGQEDALDVFRAGPTSTAKPPTTSARPAATWASSWCCHAASALAPSASPSSPRTRPTSSS